MSLPLITNAFQVLLSACLFALMLLQGAGTPIVPVAIVLVALGLFSLFAQLVSLMALDWSGTRLLILGISTFVPFLINLDLMVNNVWHAHNAIAVSADAIGHAVVYLFGSSASGFAFFQAWKRRTSSDVNTMFGA